MISGYILAKLFARRSHTKNLYGQGRRNSFVRCKCHTEQALKGLIPDCCYKAEMQAGASVNCFNPNCCYQTRDDNGSQAMAIVKDTFCKGVGRRPAPSLTMDVNLMHPTKASSQIVVMEVGMAMDCKLLHPAERTPPSCPCLLSNV